MTANLTALPSDRIAAAERRVTEAAVPVADWFTRCYSDVRSDRDVAAFLDAVAALRAAREPTADEMAEGIVKQHVQVRTDEQSGQWYNTAVPRDLTNAIAAALVDASGGKMKRRGE